MSGEPLLLRAPNPGPFTLSGTNTWVIGRDPCYVIDPGPEIEAHLRGVAAACEQRGGAAMVLLTHDHHDHADGVPRLVALLGGVPVAGARGAGRVILRGGERAGPFTVHATPGHAPDHLAFAHEGHCFTGDAVLGEGSVFVAPDPGAMSAYLRALQKLRELELVALHPGHGPRVDDPRTKLDEYIAHRIEREHALVAALEDGLRGVDELLDRVWSDAPTKLRVAAAITLEAHLGKLEDEARLPPGVERQSFAWLRDAAL